MPLPPIQPTPPPTDHVAHARIAFSAGLSDAPGFPVGRTALASETPWQHDAPTTWLYSRTFTLFATAPPGASGSVQASLHGRAYKPASSYATAVQRASSVEPLLRTALLYADRAELRASFVLRDTDGRSLVSSVRLNVRMVATGPSGTTLTSSACAHGSAAYGVGDCASFLPPDWFSSAVTSQVRVVVRVYYSSVLVASAHAGNATLAASPVHTAPTAAGLRAVMPHSPRFRDDEFDVPITAHTNPSAGYALNAWSLALAWRSDTLALVSFRSSALFATPTTNRDDTAGTLL